MGVINRLLTLFMLCVLLCPCADALSVDRVSDSPEREADNAAAPKIVKVGGYDFPPYVYDDAGTFKGLTIDFIEMLNAVQFTYRFQFVPTSSMRRFKDFEDGVFDVILFENVQWGWKGIPVEVSRVYARDCEVFVAKAQPGRNEAYFDDLKGKSLRVYLGYHYPFAEYNADPHYLLRKHNARTTVSHEANIRSVLAGRSDLAVVTSSYLQKYLRDNPACMPKLLVSRRTEQDYCHTILVRKGIEPSIETMNALLDQLEKAGYTAILLGKYGIDQTSIRTAAEPLQSPVAEDANLQSEARVAVKVGGYHFPPYVEHVSGNFKGLTLDLIELMNAFQSRYHFVFVPTTPVTRHKDFDDGSFDVAFFEHKEWGWQDRPVAASREFLRDAEVYVSRLVQGRTQQYFENLNGKSLLGYVGYHYPIADFQTDPVLLLQRYNMRLSASHADNMRAVVDGGADIAIVTRSFAVHYLRNHPAYIPRVLLSERVAQDYRHTVLVRDTAQPILKDIMDILSALERAGYSSLLWGKYDLTAVPESP
jgi:polar amino acid transport system substrate-binding protein